MAELDKGRQAQYREKVAESLPPQLAMVDTQAFYKDLGIALEKSGALDGLSPDQRDAVLSNVETALEIGDASTIFNKAVSCRYGHNPGNPAAFYQEQGAKGPCTAHFEVLKEGKGLGYINIGDLDLVQRLTKSLHDISPGKLVATIAKHEMPSGGALGTDPLQTYEDAWGTDKKSSFGGVVVFSYAVTPEMAELLARPGRNTEVVAAPKYLDGSLEKLATREPLRVLQMTGFDKPVVDNGMEYKRTAGGLLVEPRFQTEILTPGDLDCISKAKPTDQDIRAALLAWHTAVFTRSNAVTIASENIIHGIGSGQRSRIDSANNAIELSKRGYGPKGTMMASDAYMPEKDVAKKAAANRIRGIVYPLGSNKDEEVLALADELELVMLITRKPGVTKGGERCFLHR